MKKNRAKMPVIGVKSAILGVAEWNLAFTMPDKLKLSPHRIECVCVGGGGCDKDKMVQTDSC